MRLCIHMPLLYWYVCLYSLYFVYFCVYLCTYSSLLFLFIDVWYVIQYSGAQAICGKRQMNMQDVLLNDCMASVCDLGKATHLAVCIWKPTHPLGPGWAYGLLNVSERLKERIRLGLGTTKTGGSSSAGRIRSQIVHRLSCSNGRETEAAKHTDIFIYKCWM